MSGTENRTRTSAIGDSPISCLTENVFLWARFCIRSSRGRWWTTNGQSHANEDWVFPIFAFARPAKTKLTKRWIRMVIDFHQNLWKGSKLMPTNPNYLLCFKEGQGNVYSWETYSAYLSAADLCRTFANKIRWDKLSSFQCKYLSKTYEWHQLLIQNRMQSKWLTNIIQSFYGLQNGRWASPSSSSHRLASICRFLGSTHFDGVLFLATFDNVSIRIKLIGFNVRRECATSYNLLHSPFSPMTTLFTYLKPIF